MKHILSFILIIGFFGTAYAQYPNTSNKIRLGAQTTGDGLIFRTDSIPDWTPSTINNAWLAVDTLTGNLYSYQGGEWRLEVAGDLRTVYPKVINKSGTNIKRGQPVMVDYTQIIQGDLIRVRPADGSGTYSGVLTMGIASTDIANNAEGFITWFGYVREVKQSDIMETGDTVTIGDILYLSGTELGKLTTTEPTAPKLRVTMALVVRKPNANNMTLLVRPALNMDLGELNDVDLTGLNDGETIVWDSLNGKWIAGTAGSVIDTNVIATRAYVDGKVDSTRLVADSILVYYIGGVEVGRDTINIPPAGVTSITAGVGLTGGTITSTGTIAADTATVLATKDYVTTRGYLTTEVDGSVTNEGVLGVGAGGANTAVITSNTSGANGVTISGGVGALVTETTSTNGGTVAVAVDTANIVSKTFLTNQGYTTNTGTVTGTGANGRVSFWTGTNSQSGDAGLFWDNSSKNLGIGLTLPEERLHVRGNIRALNTTFVSAIQSESVYNGSVHGLIGGRGSRGTLTNALPLLQNDFIAYFSANGNGETGGAPAYGNSVGVFGFFAAEDFTPTSKPSYFRIETTPTGTTTRSERLRILSDGNVGIGTTTPSVRLDVAGTDGIRIPTGTTGQRPGTPLVGMMRNNTSNNNLDFYTGTAWENYLKSATATGLGTAGRVFYADANGRATSADTLFWDATNRRLGVNTVSPTANLQVQGNAVISDASLSTLTVQSSNSNWAALELKSTAPLGRTWRILASASNGTVGNSNFVLFDATAAQPRFGINSSGYFRFNGTNAVYPLELSNTAVAVGTLSSGGNLNAMALMGNGLYLGVRSTNNDIVFGMFSQQRDFVWAGWNGSNIRERMRLTFTNNLMIGATTDTGQRLQVQGQVRIDTLTAIPASLGGYTQTSGFGVATRVRVGNGLSLQGDSLSVTATGATNLTFSGASSPVTLNSDTGTDVTLTAGDGISFSQTSNNLTISRASPIYAVVTVDSNRTSTFLAASVTPDTIDNPKISQVGGVFSVVGNGIQYTSGTARTFLITANADFKFSEANNVVKFQGWRSNGGTVIDLGTFGTVESLLGNETMHTSFSAITSLSNNDLLRFGFTPAAHTGDDTLVLTNLSITITQL